VRGLCIHLCVLAGAAAMSLAADNPEAQRFPDRTFRRGLQKRGLTDLLEPYLAENPPADPIEALLLRRELKLTQHADDTLPEEERMAALAEADAVLEELVSTYPDDDRVFEWRLELAKSLLYERAEPLYTDILFWGRSPDECRRLAELMETADDTLTQLIAALEEKYAQLDDLSARQYDRLERSGYVDRIESMTPEAKYLRWWVTLYGALARDEHDPARESQLRGLLDTLDAGSEALTTPHETSHVQAQCFLLVGMASQLAGRHADAVAELDQAVGIVRGVAKTAERDSLQWVVTLALLEKARALSDNGQYDQARDASAQFRQHVGRIAPAQFGLQLVAALLERSIDRAQADRAEAAGDRGSAIRLREQSVQAFVQLAELGPTYRDEVYATLYDRIDPGADPQSLPPLERCALLAGRLREAQEVPPASAAEPDAGGAAPAANREERRSQQIERLDGVIALAEDLLRHADSLPPDLHAEILFNLAVAQHRRGHRREAASRFVQVADEFPRFGRSEMAANNAVQLAAELYFDPSLRDQPGVRTLYRHALETLVGDYPETNAGRYWRFFLAQALEEVGELDQAAREYAQVDPSHEHYAEALFSAVRCQANAVKELASQESPDADALRRGEQAVRQAADAFNTMAERGDDFTSGAPDRAKLAGLSARTALNVAEVCVLRGVDQPDRALEGLQDFESRFPEQRDLIGRVLRVRVLAFEALGRLDEAKAAIPRYVQSDPAQAGATLQGLLESIREDADRLRKAGRDAEAQAKAASALLVAQQICRWAEQHDPPLDPAHLQDLRIQLAQSHLDAGHPEQARALFAQCAETDARSPVEGQAPDLRAVRGLGEALYRLGRFEEALPLFNRVVMESPERSPEWWEALLRDLQCRTELKQDPQGILTVIAQQQFLNPNLGGEAMKQEFQKLRRTNQQRRQRAG
jgi:tetratricopeptide (TPR) repeat protein